MYYTVYTKYIAKVVVWKDMEQERLFDEDYCDGCGTRVKSDTLEENNGNWYCVECTRQMDEEGEKRMKEYQQDQMLEEQERESYDDNNPYEGDE